MPTIINGDGVVTAGGTASTQGRVVLAERTGSGTNTVTIQAPATLAADLTFTLPNADGTNGQYLRTDGAGTLSFATVPTTSPAGSTGQLQYNNAGAFGAVSSGTSGQLLQSAGAGAAPVWATVSGGAEILIATSTGSGASSYNFFTSSFSDTYSIYRIVYAIRKTSSGANTFYDNIKFYIDGTLRSTNYFWSGSQSTYNQLNNSTYSQASNMNGATSLNGIYGGGDSTINGVVIFGEMYLMNARGSANSTTLGGFWREYSPYYGPVPYVVSANRAITNNLSFTTGLTGINIDTGGATDTSIQISLYGVLR